MSKLIELPGPNHWRHSIHVLRVKCTAVPSTNFFQVEHYQMQPLTNDVLGSWYSMVVES